MPLDFEILIRRLLFAAIALVLFLLAIWIIRKCKRSKDGSDRTNRSSTRNCTRIPDRVYRRPDPLLYAQWYLLAQGLAVTWDNPDIEIQQGGVPVSSESLT